MAEINQSTMKTVNIHQSKIDVVKFEDTNNFIMLRCEVMDALTISDLEYSLLYDKKLGEISKKDWDKMNQTTCDAVRSCLTQDLKYHVMIEIFSRKIWEILESSI